MTAAAHRPATLEDVARVAGVSRSTASRVIAGTGFASPAARELVTAAVDQLGYVPNPAARALVRGGGGGVRMVVAVLGTSAAVLDDPYVHRVVGSAARVCTAAGVGVALQWLPLGGSRSLDKLAEDRTVCGVILINTTEDLLDGVPRSLHGRVVSIGIGSATVPSFDIDNAAGSDAVLRHLYATGRRRIAMVTGPRWLPCAQRPVQTYRRLMSQAGLPERVLPGDFTAARGRVAAGVALRQWPDVDAIYSISDDTALGVMAGLRDAGVRVPDDVAVAGFDDIPLAGLTAPALTTASHPVGRIAAAAATALLDGRPSAPVTLFPSALVARASA
ncbi:LacI family DNA-binding transcriptional regulator [Micromonospora zamorensis]|uniref:LacI family DNA-binding transcriptional regulator n=3 Tax=Micromonospora zamorensis TaxID=709883 RepID=UPI0033AB951D